MGDVGGGLIDALEQALELVQRAVDLVANHIDVAATAVGQRHPRCQITAPDGGQRMAKPVDLALRALPQQHAGGDGQQHSTRQPPAQRAQQGFAGAPDLGVAKSDHHGAIRRKRKRLGEIALFGGHLVGQTNEVGVIDPTDVIGARAALHIAGNKIALWPL